ncbi:MAG: L,D-transpeptidase, partial [Candidatus Limnocylindria bacterium]
LCGSFADYWHANGGLKIFGFPLTEPYHEEDLIVQYFERARFEWHADLAGTKWEVLLGRLGAVEAARDRASTTPSPRPDGVQDYDPILWKVPAPPPVEVPAHNPPAGAPIWEAQWIEVDISGQYLRAWEYETLMLDTWVSTGLPGYETPTGAFRVFSKLRYDDMTSGQFVDPSEYYYVEDVPHVMYFASGGYAIHGAYWHNNFGSPSSHGCVSSPLWAAEWLYHWAAYGTRVWIHW